MDDECLINVIVEQVMYAAEKGSRWWPWALACGITQGGPGIWALHMIGMCAMSWSAPVDVVYDPGFAMAGFAVPVCCTFVAFRFAIYGYRRNKILMEKASSFVGSQQQPTGQKAAVAVRNSGGNQRYEHDKTQTISADTTHSNDDGSTTGTKKRRLIKRLSADHSVLGQVCSFLFHPLRMHQLY
jgi:hypothetical protein